MRQLAYAVIAATVFLTHSALAQTTYTWNGTSDTNWQTLANWQSSSQPASGSTINGRLNVNNGLTGNQLIYTAAEGVTSFSSPTLTVRGLVIGSASNGQMTITGGTFSTAGTATGDIIGNGATGALIVNGGNFITSSTTAITLALSGVSTGSLTVASGSVTSAAGINLGGSGATGGAATVNLDGGTLSTGNIIVAGVGTRTFNFNGGTLKAVSSSASFMTGLTTANVRNGGAVIDTNGKNITVGQALVHSTIGGDNATDGGLTKDGSGVLTLTGANTYTGLTLVNAGTLATGAAGALGISDVSVASGAILTLGNNTSIGDTSMLLFSSTSVINLSFTGTEIVGQLFDTSTSANIAVGTYSATDLNTLLGTTVFSGAGLLNVTAVPEPTVWVMLLSASLLMLIGYRKYATPSIR